MTEKEKAAPGIKTEAASKVLTANLTDRLGRTKGLLVEAYCLGALTFREAEGLASRLRRRYAYSWQAA